MPELISAYWPYILIAFFIGLAVAWFAFAANRKTSITRDPDAPRDVLDEGAERAQRNDALIKSAPASSAVKAEKAPVSNTQDMASLGNGDDLTRIKGLGPKIASILSEQGITRFEQIAQWSDADIDRIDANLGRFEGRIRRDSWVEQAKLLASGDESGFAQQYGNT